MAIPSTLTSRLVELKTHPFFALLLFLSFCLSAAIFVIVLLSVFFPRVSATTTTVLLLAVLREQQDRAREGAEQGERSVQPYGIVFRENSYSTFQGEDFAWAVPGSRETVPLENEIALSSTFPSNVVLFESGSGDIKNYSADHNSITITHQGTGKKETIVLNRFGIVLHRQ